MAQLWGGRFTKETDTLVKKFNDSLPFDKRLWREDIEGSIAHAQMLGKQSILTAEEASRIVRGLKEIADDIEKGNHIDSLKEAFNNKDAKILMNMKIFTASSRQS